MVTRRVKHCVGETLNQTFIDLPTLRCVACVIALLGLVYIWWSAGFLIDTCEFVSVVIMCMCVLSQHIRVISVNVSV
jgi:hypothetical protein